MAAKKAPAKKAAPKAKPATKKSDGPAKKAPAKKASAAAAAPAVKKPVVKLTEKQAEFLKKIEAAGEAGYSVLGAEKRSIESLVEKKLLKSKTDKATKAITALLTAAGKKHLSPAASKA